MARSAVQPRQTEVEEARAPKRRNRVNLFELAYERIEAMLVTCELPPGRFLSLQDLQDMTGYGRTLFTTPSTGWRRIR